ncbi:MAG: PAS domain-containing protein [Candidatus Schekmanbacteria bacterium]|nr:PAS domain-containing protein [Candidatus Schekmanbacteria bacterium]
MVSGAVQGSRPARDLRSSLRILVALRVVIATTLLGASVFVQLRPDTYVSRFPFTLIGSIYAATIIYALTLAAIRSTRGLVALAYAQIFGDLGFVTLAVFGTGGIDSPFSFLYIISVITAAMILYRPGAIITAAISSVLYGSLLVALYTGTLPQVAVSLYPSSTVSVRYVVLHVFLNTSAFFLVAYLSAHLSEQLREKHQELEARTVDLLSLQEFNRSILECMSSGLLTTNMTGVITSFNRAAERITGLRRAQAVGQSITELFPGLVFQTAGIFAEKGSVFRGELTWHDRAGTAVYLGFSLSPMTEPREGICGVIVTFQDLTELKRLESEARRADRLEAIAKLSAGIAHEIRNPLASMSGAIQVLRREEGLVGLNKQLMDIVLRECDRLNTLITDFLTFARPKPPRLQPTDLWRVLSETLTLLRTGDRPGCTMELRSAASDGAHWIENVDPEQARQVFWNLALNGLEAMPNGGALSIALDRRRDDSGKLLTVVSFADQGCGVAPEAMANIFEPFFSTKSAGSGLGLAIANRIAVAHGGWISVESTSGEGTVFAVHLPHVESAGKAGDAPGDHGRVRDGAAERRVDATAAGQSPLDGSWNAG